MKFWKVFKIKLWHGLIFIELTLNCDYLHGPWFDEVFLLLAFLLHVTITRIIDRSSVCLELFTICIVLGVPIDCDNCFTMRCRRKWGYRKKITQKKWRITLFTVYIWEVLTTRNQIYISKFNGKSAEGALQKHTSCLYLHKQSASNDWLSISVLHST